jgi:hypothetical protein
MELSTYAEALGRELARIARVAGEDAARTAGLLSESLDSAIRLTLLEALSDAAAEVTAELDGAAVEVRLSGGQPTFVVTPAARTGPPEPPGPDAAEAGEEAGTARVTLRLPEALKARVESAAARDGISVNSWLVRAASQAVQASGGSFQAGGRHGPGRRITGYARS